MQRQWSGLLSKRWLAHRLTRMAKPPGYWVKARKRDGECGSTAKPYFVSLSRVSESSLASLDRFFSLCFYTQKNQNLC